MNFLRSTFDSIKTKVQDLRDGHRCAQIADEWLTNKIPEINDEQKYYLADRSSIPTDIHNLMDRIFSRLGSRNSKRRQILNALKMAEFLLQNGSERIVGEIRDEIYVLKTFKSYHSAEGEEDRLDECIRSVAGKICDWIENKELLQDQREQAERLRERFGFGKRKEGGKKEEELDVIEKEIREEIVAQEIEKCAEKKVEVDPRFAGYSNEDYERELREKRDKKEKPKFVTSFKKNDEEVEREMDDRWRKYENGQNKQDEGKTHDFDLNRKKVNGKKPRRLKRLPKAPGKKGSKLAQRLGITAKTNRDPSEKIDNKLEVVEQSQNVVDDEMDMIDFLGGGDSQNMKNTTQPKANSGHANSNLQNANDNLNNYDNINTQKNNHNEEFGDDLIDFGAPISPNNATVPSQNQTQNTQSQNNDLDMLDFGNSQNTNVGADLNLLDFQAPRQASNQTDDFDLLVGAGPNSSSKKPSSGAKIAQNSMFSDIRSDLFDLSNMGQALGNNLQSQSQSHNNNNNNFNNSKSQMGGHVGSGYSNYGASQNMNYTQKKVQNGVSKPSSGITFNEFDLI